VTNRALGVLAAELQLRKEEPFETLKPWLAGDIAPLSIGAEAKLG